MDKTTKIIIGIIIAVIIIGGIWYNVIRKPAEKGAIKIGVLTPLTGTIAEYGNNVKMATELAVEEINREGGINGRDVQLLFEDSKCDPKEAVNGFSKMVDLQGVKIVLGTVCSGETLAIAPLANEKHVLVISACASSPKITEAGDFIFRTFPSDDFEADIAADTIFNKLNKQKVSIIYLNNDYGLALKDAFQKKFKGTVLDTEAYLQNDRDFRTQLSKIKEKNPEVIYMVSYPVDGGLLVKQMKELRINALIFGGSGIKAVNFISNGGKASEGTILATPKEISSQKRNDFLNNYENKFNAKAGLCSDMAYDSVYMLKQAMEKTNSITATKDNLYKMQEFDGVSGKIGFDQNGDRTGSEYELLIVKNGQFVPYKE